MDDNLTLTVGSHVFDQVRRQHITPTQPSEVFRDRRDVFPGIDLGRVVIAMIGVEDKRRRGPMADNLVVSGTVGGIAANILLDTGAEANLIGTRLIEKLKITKATCRVDRTVVIGAQSERELMTLGVSEQVVTFKGRKSDFCRSLEFIATPDYKGDVIIGAPTLKKWNVTMMLGEHGSVITLKEWLDEKLEEALLNSSTHRLVSDSKGFHNLRVEKKRVWGMELLDVVPPSMMTSICDFYSKQAQRKLDSVESLSKDVVPTLNKIVAIRPTIVYMRFAKKSQLYHFLDLTFSYPLIFQLRDKVLGIASFVSTSERARKWRELMRQNKKLDAKCFQAKQVFPQNDETRAAVSYVVEHLKSLELSDTLEEKWRGDGKGADEDNVDEDLMFPPTDVKEKPLPTRAQITEMVKCDNPKLKLHVMKLLENHISLLGDPRTAKVTGYEHHIRLMPGTNGISAGREVPEAHKDIVRDEVKRLLEAKTIIPAPEGLSPFVSPVVIVPKKDENGLLTKKRFCVDYRQLNKKTVRDQYALPNLESCLNLRSGVIFSKVDLASAFHQIPLAVQDQVKTGFVADRRVYLWRYMPFGLTNAPATMQRLIDVVLGTAKDQYAQGYLDDIIVYSRDEVEHVRHLTDVFGRLHRHGLRIGLLKCEFGRSSIIFLGHLISNGVIGIDPSKVEGVSKLARPTCVKELQHVLGVTGWCRRFIYNYASITAPLTNLFRKDVTWVWGEAQEKAFNRLREALMQKPILIQPDFARPFILETDASDEGLGAVLLQHTGPEEKGEMKPIAYMSRKLIPAERQYSTREKECLAIVWATERLQTYLWGRVFKVYTDHRSLQWVQHAMHDNSRIGRWARKLSRFEFDIKFRAGALNQVADGLSRASRKGDEVPKVVLTVIKLVMVNTRGQLSRQAAAERKLASASPSPSLTGKRRRESKSKLDAREGDLAHAAGLGSPKESLESREPSTSRSIQVEPHSGVAPIPPTAKPSAPLREEKELKRETPVGVTQTEGGAEKRSEIPSRDVDMSPEVKSAPLLSGQPGLLGVTPEVRPSTPVSAPTSDGRGEASARPAEASGYGRSGGPAGSGSELPRQSVRRRVHEPSRDMSEESLSPQTPLSLNDVDSGRDALVRSALTPAVGESLLAEEGGLDEKHGMETRDKKQESKDSENFDELGMGQLDLSTLLTAESKKLSEESAPKLDKRYEVPDKEVWRRLLLTDPTYGQIIKYLTGEEVPGSRADRDRLNTVKAKYIYEQGLLYFRKALDDGSERLLAEVPEVCRRNLVQMYHDMATAGHRGEEAMVKMIRQHYNWSTLRKDVREYVQACVKCWLAKTPASSRSGLLVQWGTRVEKFSVVHIDFVGPLPFLGKKDERFVFTMKDRGTGMIEAVPLVDKTAVSAASALWRFWICKFGVPKVLVSDRDRAFCGSLFKCLSEQLGYDISQTTAYHPQSNGMLERDHRTFKAFLNTCCLGSPTRWPEKLSTFCFVVNSTPRDHFTYSPFFLAFGVDPRLPAVALDKKIRVLDLDEYVAGLTLQLSDAREVVIRERLAAEARQKKQYDRFRVQVNFEVGDIVFKRMEKGQGTASKFWIPWRGPYKIVKRNESGVDWTIENADKDMETVHVSKLAAFRLNTEIPLTISEDMSPEEEAITTVLEDWRKDRYAEDYGHAFSMDRKVEKASPEEKAEDASLHLQPLKPAEEVKLDLKEDSFVLVAASGYEDLMQVVQVDTLQCRMLKPVSRNDTGSSRAFAKLYYDSGDGNYWVTNTLSTK